MLTKKEIEETRERIRARLNKAPYAKLTIFHYEKKAVKRYRETIRGKYSTKIYSKYMAMLSRNKGITIPIEHMTQLDSAHCYYCDGKASGLDRIDSSIGYTKQNTVWCCGKCNLMKHIHSKDDFLNHIAKIYNHAVKQDNKEA